MSDETINKPKCEPTNPYDMIINEDELIDFLERQISLCKIGLSASKTSQKELYYTGMETAFQRIKDRIEREMFYPK